MRRCLYANKGYYYVDSGGINIRQEIHHGAAELAGILERFKKPLLVCGRSFDQMLFRNTIGSLNCEIVRFSEFSPNPKYEDVCKGVEAFNISGCDGILAVGGGSAIDVAKCIKLFCKMDLTVCFLKQPYTDTGVQLIAVPTTAGSGAESTKNAVIYFNGDKQSVSHFSILPDYVVLEPSVLAGLSPYQKKCTMLDALCQGIESWWSVHSTVESIAYARAAVEGIVRNWQKYIENNHEAAASIMEAANLAGQAINITATTAPHAMSYKLTTLYGIPHGHAVALGMSEVWEYMAAHTENCVDARGEAYFRSVLSDIAGVMDLSQFRTLLHRLDIGNPISRNRESDINDLVDSVNVERLKNNPIAIDKAALRNMYGRILKYHEG